VAGQLRWILATTGSGMTEFKENNIERDTGAVGDSLEMRWLGTPRALFIAIGSLGIAVALLLTGGIPLHAIGYAFSCLIPFTLVALFRRMSLRRMAALGVASPAWAKPLGTAIIVLGFVLAVLHAWSIAADIA
jgi:hypothetical protein